MLDLIREAIGWARAYVVHAVVMFYWAWIPGILGAAILSARYRPRLEAMTRKPRSAAAGVWAAIGWGMLSGAGRTASLATAERLRGQGTPEPVVLAYLVASHTLGLYLFLLLTFLIGSAFSLGLFLGGLVMIGLLCLVAPLLGPERAERGSLDTEAGEALRSWRILLGSREGFRAILREAARPLRHLAGSLLGGLTLGAVILALDNNGYWFFPSWMGDQGLGSTLAASFLAPLLSVVLFLAPGGNLFVASSLWKTETLAYPGVLSFVLMSLLNPLTIRALLRQHGRRRGWRLVLAIYVTAALSGLAVTGLFTLVGLEVTHGRTWFEGLVDRIIRALPVTTPGAPGGQMNGM